MNREQEIELRKQSGQVVYDSEVIIEEAFQRMKQHNVDSGTMSLSFLHKGLHELDTALPQLQFNILEMLEQSVRLHRQRLVEEGHVFSEDDLWEEFTHMTDA